jgi:structural maintenance of chromosome 2
MSELIYKDGYAGITKATVAIKFACPDRKIRPTGYEDCDELLITRHINNGATSTLTKVKNLFRSVSLNIDNPHFLVKQGQITKIINLKPIELLGML